jgi:4-hydroxybenzoate polyprenyltransferase
MSSTTPQTTAVISAPTHTRSAVAALSAARPRQWIKNLTLFAAILFAAKLGDGFRWLEAAVAFSAYCLVASGAYLFNDVRDVADDRLHPVKRLRPVAAGDLTPRSGLMLAGVLVVTGAGLASALGWRSLVFIVAFGLLQLAYTLRLKRVAFLDIAVIAIFFVIRAAAGAAAVQVRISPWLLACTGLLALFLGLAKRRGELVLAGRGQTAGRSVLRAYSLPVVDGLLWAAAAAALIAYAIYTLVAHDSREMVLTVPFVAAGLGRYLQLVHRHGLGEAPEHVLLSDRQLLGTVALWAVVTAAIIGAV